MILSSQERNRDRINSGIDKAQATKRLFGFMDMNAHKVLRVDPTTR